LDPESCHFTGGPGRPTGPAPVRVEPDLPDWIPVAEFLRPATGMASAGLLVDRRALRQDGHVQPLVALVWGDEPDAAVTMLPVVPVHEVEHPESGLAQRVETVGRVVRAILAGAPPGSG
jgi:hypothetical protein